MSKKISVSTEWKGLSVHTRRDSHTIRSCRQIIEARGDFLKNRIDASNSWFRLCALAFPLSLVFNDQWKICGAIEFASGLRLTSNLALYHFSLFSLHYFLTWNRVFYAVVDTELDCEMLKIQNIKIVCCRWEIPVLTIELCCSLYLTWLCGGWVGREMQFRQKCVVFFFNFSTLTLLFVFFSNISPIFLVLLSSS